MIDDEALEDLLGEVGEAVPLPPEGAESILRARNALRSGSTDTPRMGGKAGGAGAGRGIWLVAAVVALIAGAAAVLAVHGSGRSSGLHSASASRSLVAIKNAEINCAACRQATGAGGMLSQSAPVQASGTSPAGVAGAGSSSAASPAAVQGASTPATVSGPSVVEPTKVVETGSISVQIGTGQLQDTMNRLTGLAGAEGGFVASSNTDSESGQAPSGSVTLRIPVAQFGAALNQVRDLGKVLSVTTNGQDVTSEYVNLQAQIQAQQAAETQYEQILTKAESISDILSVEQQISQLQDQIDQLQGQLNVLDNETTYSSLAVTVTEVVKQQIVVPPPKSQPQSGISKAWGKARHNFAHGVEAVIGASGGIAVFLLFVGLFLLAGRVAWLRLRHHLI